MVFNEDKIKVVAFDVDGTLYSKDKVYKQGCGAIQDAHDFFIFNAWQMMRDGKDPYETALILRERYKNDDFSISIADKAKADYEDAYKIYHSSALVFDNVFNLNDKKFLHREMISYVDFSKILADDPKLRELFACLKQKYSLAILTGESRKTVEAVSKAMGFDLGLFETILCSDNMKERKPSVEVYFKLLENMKIADPQTVVYVGDHIIKDVEAPLKAGLHAIHVTNASGKKLLESISKEYMQVKEIYDVAGVL